MEMLPNACAELLLQMCSDIRIAKVGGHVPKTRKFVDQLALRIERNIIW